MEAIVIDNGSCETRVGYAGNDFPTATFPTVIARDSLRQSNYVGYYALQNHRSKNLQLLLFNPIERGLVTDWTDMENVWGEAFYSALKVMDTDERPVLLTEPALNPSTNREKMTQIMFESFSVPSLYIANQSLLSLFAVGAVTGLVLESGHGVTHAVPIVQARVIDSAIMRLDIGGIDLTEYLMKLLRETYTLSDSGVIEDIKRKTCLVAQDFEQEMQAIANASRLTNGYELPDGDMVFPGTGRIKCPEVMFQPSMLGLETDGIHEMVHKSISKCNTDVHRILYNNIALAGGNTMFDGIKERLQKEVTNLAPADTIVRVNASSDRRYSAWIGGSMLAVLDGMAELWTTKAAYEECGPGIVHKQAEITP